MLKKTALCLLLLSSGASQAFDGTLKFVTRSEGVEHTLLISHWQVDRKGVPSFDYAYRQQAGSCQFKLDGHVVADVEEHGGKAELVVFNPEDDNGKELPPIVTYSDDTVSMTLPYKGAPRQVGLSSARLTPAQHAHSCGPHRDDRLSVSFHQ